MFLFLLVLCLTAVWKLRPVKFNADPLGKDQTAAVQGFFIGLVFLSHLHTYLDPSLRSAWDGYAVSALLRVGQLMVACFFFCSGYGILTSYRTKPGYEKSFMRHRFLRTLIRFDLAVLLYLLLSLAIGKEQPAEDLIFCWIGWSSLGNSNWFIFVTLVLYLITRAAFALRKISGMSERAAVALIYAMSAGLWAFLYFTKKDYWYNTLLCFPLGMSVCLHEEQLMQGCRCGRKYWPILAGTVMLFCLTYLIRCEAVYSLCAGFFCLLLMLLSMKVELRSPVLRRLGSCVFEIYVLHRFPMILLQYWGVKDPYLFGTAAAVATALLVFLFKALEKKTDAWLGL